MAEEQEDIEIPNPDAGILFRAEMFAMNVLLGYAKVLIGVVVAILLVVLVYSQYRSYQQQGQRAASAATAQIDGDLRREILAGLTEPEREAAEQFSIATMRLLAVFPLTDASREATANAAAQLTEHAAAVSGPAKAEAALIAGEYYRVVDDVEGQRKALEIAATDAEGALRYAAVGGLASVDFAEGHTDAGLDRLRNLTAEFDGYLAEQAALDLGLALEHADRNDEAAAVYAEFAKRFPESKRLDEVNSRRTRIEAG